MWAPTLDQHWLKYIPTALFMANTVVAFYLKGDMWKYSQHEAASGRQQTWKNKIQL